jgi:hypothetical protein
MLGVAVFVGLLGAVHQDRGIEQGNWTLVTSTDGEAVQMFAQPGPVRGRIWVRFEMLPGEVDGSRSARMLWELDCEQQRTRTLSVTFFPEPNMRGRSESISPTGSWDYAAPDTLAAAGLRYGCGD